MKPANKWCQHCKPGTASACSIYADRPRDCFWWSCRWLMGDVLPDMRRPDECHYVIDMVPDEIQENDGRHTAIVKVLQVWIDPGYPDAHKDPALRRYADQVGMHGYATLLRRGNTRGMVWFPPALTGQGWREVESRLKPQTDFGVMASIPEDQRPPI